MRLRTASCTFARPFACILCFRAAARHIAGDRYQHCIKQDWAKKEGVERCNKEFGQALATAYWSSWAQLAFIPVGLAWFMGWGLSFLVRRVRSGPQAGRKVALPMANDDEKRIRERQEAHDKLRIARAKAIQSAFSVLTSRKFPSCLARYCGHSVLSKCQCPFPQRNLV